MIDSSLFKILYPEAVLVIHPSLKNSTAFISYRVFQYDFYKVLKHKDISLLKSNKITFYNPFNTTATTKENELFGLGGMEKSGSISRGISFGNGQDVVVNSSFNLQLNGKLNNEVEILAAVTDDNIPIQPDGNTQQLQDFDKVFIQLTAKKNKLIAGDFELSKPEGYFMNFYKKAQGGMFSTEFDEIGKKNKSKIEITTAAAISKGKYAKNTIPGSEGNQGPYRLKGAENEAYIIVLSGTEKVYINGELLVRGQDNDYIIDYNTAQITFTAKRLITKDSRISIEFEYSDKNYARSMLFAGTGYECGKLKIHLNYFSEQDIKNQPLQQTLSENDKLLLSQIGDSLDLAVAPFVDSVAYTNDQVLYKMIDTTVNSVLYDSIFVYSTNADSAHFRLGFTNVGSGKGNYMQVQSSANGRVFRWVAPVAGIPSGDYEPVIKLITPKKKQMLSLVTDYTLSKNSSAGVEIAMSNNDINLFSPQDNKDDYGYAIKAKFKNKVMLGRKDSLGPALITEFSNEYTNKTFNPIERYRSVEFERDWNRPLAQTPEAENLASAKFTLSGHNKNTIAYQVRSLNTQNDFNGIQHALDAYAIKKGFVLDASGSLLNSKDMLNKTFFVRSIASLSKRLKWITLGIKEDQENNKFNNLSGDTLKAVSLAYTDIEGYVENAFNSKNKYKLFYSKRMDYLPSNNELKQVSTAKNLGFNMSLLKNINNRFDLTATYRQLQINDSLLTAQKEDNTLVGQMEYYLKAWKGAVVSNTYYEIGSGLEIKKEFSYLEVAPGQGIYTWTDYNGNNVKELNEFELAAFQDQANYIRVYTPTSEFIKTYTNTFSEVLNVNPALKWNKSKGVKKFIALFSDMATYRIDHKNSGNNGIAGYNPFNMNISDTALISVNSYFRNVVYFNKNSSVFSCDISFQDSRNKTLLVNGFDSRSSRSKGGSARWNLSKSISLSGKYNMGYKTNASDYFNTRDYRIFYNETSPMLTFQPNQKFRISFDYTYTEKRNRKGIGKEAAFLNTAGVNIKYNVLSKGSLMLKTDYVLIKFNSSENTPLSYEMLEGLKSGRNAVWNVSYERNLSGNLQLTLSYDGRKSENVKMVHVGSMQLRAYF